MIEPSTADLFLSDEDTARCMADRHEAWMHPGPGELPAESYVQGRFDHFHVVSRLPDGRFKSVLCLGSAKGGEFLAIFDRSDELTIVEPSRKLCSHSPTTATTTTTTNLLSTEPSQDVSLKVRSS